MLTSFMKLFCNMLATFRKVYLYLHYKFIKQMQIKKKILDEINKGEKANTIKGELIKANDKHPGTVQRWIDNNEEVLTTAKNLQIICDQLGMTQKQILEEENKAA